MPGFPSFKVWSPRIVRVEDQLLVLELDPADELGILGRSFRP